MERFYDVRALTEETEEARVWSSSVNEGSTLVKLSIERETNYVEKATKASRVSPTSFGVAGEQCEGFLYNIWPTDTSVSTVLSPGKVNECINTFRPRLYVLDYTQADS